MWTAVLVFLGSGLGGLGRYGCAQLIPSRADGVPWETLAVNVLGSGLIAFLALFVPDPRWQAFVLVGMLGGFTTFSSFSKQSLDLLRGGHVALALVYVGLSLLCCLLAAGLGYWLGGLLKG